MPVCAAFGCTNRPSKKTPGISFHRFPAKTELRQAWILACGRKDWWPSKTSFLCSKHFSEDLIDRTSLAIVRLRDNAVPNIFPGYPSYLQTVKKTGPAPVEKTFAAVSKEPATSTMKSETTLSKAIMSKNGECVLVNDGIVKSLSACVPTSNESVLGNQPTLGEAQTAVILGSTDSVPALIERIQQQCTAASTKEDHENETLKQTLGTIFMCCKVIKEPATSAMTSETPPTNTSSIPAPAVSDASMSSITYCENLTLKQKVKKLQDTIVKCRKKIKVLQQEKRRTAKRTIRLKHLVAELRKNQVCTHKASEHPVEPLKKKQVCTLEASEHPVERLNENQVCTLEASEDSIETLNENQVSTLEASELHSNTASAAKECLKKQIRKTVHIIKL